MKLLFYDDVKSRKPSVNLAINNSYFKKVMTEEYDAIARVYRHEPGIILGCNESEGDINKNVCSSLGYEVVRRPSGGSAVLVDPSIICYSIFLSKKLMNNGGFNDLYKKIVFPLAQKMGEEFEVKGNYYIRQRTNSGLLPVAGHSMNTSKEVFQFDGIIHTEPLNMSYVKRMLKLRELRTYEDESVIAMEDDIYTLGGKKTDILKEDTKLVRKEEDILKQIQGINESGVSEDKFINFLYETLTDAFGVFEKGTLPETLEEIVLKKEKNYLNARGHCFVDFGEPEENF